LRTDGNSASSGRLRTKITNAAAIGSSTRPGTQNAERQPYPDEQSQPASSHEATLPIW